VAVHPTAIIEPGVTVGRATAIWDSVHVRHSAQIGAECVIEEKTHIAYEVVIEDRVRIGAFVYVAPRVTIETGVSIGSGCVFTEERFFDNNPELRPARVREGARIGANCVIEPGITIGRFAIVAPGSVVTGDVPDFVLVRGNPAVSLERPLSTKGTV
jgi:acetyltransferase-like isoleucine patch superfamily enzyme